MPWSHGSWRLFSLWSWANKPLPRRRSARASSLQLSTSKITAAAKPQSRRSSLRWQKSLRDMTLSPSRRSPSSRTRRAPVVSTRNPQFAISRLRQLLVAVPSHWWYHHASATSSTPSCSTHWLSAMWLAQPIRTTPARIRDLHTPSTSTQVGFP